MSCDRPAAQGAGPFEDTDPETRSPAERRGGQARETTPHHGEIQVLHRPLLPPDTFERRER
jgi:hypothetical protein